jgi:hypothetical protein
LVAIDKVRFASRCKEASGGVGVGRMITAGLNVMQWKALPYAFGTIRAASRSRYRHHLSTLFTREPLDTDCFGAQCASMAGATASTVVWQLAR